MRKGRDGEKKTGRKKKRGKKKKRLMKIVATTSFASSLPPERRPLERRTLVPTRIIQWNNQKIKYLEAKYKEEGKDRTEAAPPSMENFENI